MGTITAGHLHGNGTSMAAAINMGGISSLPRTAHPPFSIQLGRGLTDLRESLEVGKDTSMIDDPSAEQQDMAASMRHAIRSMDINALRALASHDPVEFRRCVDSEGGKPGSQITLLMKAVRNNDRESVELLVQHGANVNLASAWGQTALIYAVRNLEIFKCIAAVRGVDINHEDEFQRSALTYAITFGYREVAKYLLFELYASPNGRGPASPLLAAAQAEDYEMVASLLQCGAQCSEQTMENLLLGRYGLGKKLSVFEGMVLDLEVDGVSCSKQIKEMFLLGGCRYGPGRELTLYERMSLAIAGDRLDYLMYWSNLSPETFFNQLRDFSNCDPYLLDLTACVRGGENLVKYLLNHGALLDWIDGNNQTILMRILSYGHYVDLKVFKCLVECGRFNLEYRDNNGWTVLMHAASRGLTEIVHYLITEREVRYTDDFFISLILRDENRKILFFLLWGGLTFDHVNAFGQTALMGINLKDPDVLSLHDFVNISKLMMVDLERQDNRGWTILNYAVDADRCDIVRYLVDQRLVNPRGGDGESPMHIAIRRKSNRMLNLMREYEDLTIPMADARRKLFRKF